MAHIDKTVPGSFCWMELATTNQNAAKAFYTSLFGWAASDAGRMAIIQDPTGAVFQAWQPLKHGEIGISNVHGAFCWADLNTGDVAAASAFYSGLLGWKLEAGEKDPSGYLHIRNGDSFIGGIPPAEHRDPNAPPHWMLYFEVADCDASAAKATELGARPIVPSISMEGVGRMSAIADPQGAVFALFATLNRGTRTALDVRPERQRSSR